MKKNHTEKTILLSTAFRQLVRNMVSVFLCPATIAVSSCAYILYINITYIMQVTKQHAERGKNRSCNWRQVPANGRTPQVVGVSTRARSFSAFCIVDRAEACDRSVADCAFRTLARSIPPRSPCQMHERLDRKSVCRLLES